MSTSNLMIYFIVTAVAVFCAFIAGVYYQRKKQAFKSDSIQDEVRAKACEEKAVEPDRIQTSRSIEKTQPSCPEEYQSLVIELSNLLGKPLNELRLSGDISALKLRVAQVKNKTKPSQRGSLSQSTSARRSSPEQLSYSNRPVRHPSSEACQKVNNSALDYSNWKTKKKEQEDALRKKEREKELYQEQIKLLRQTEEQEKIERQLYLAERTKYFKSLADKDLDYLWITRKESEMGVDEECLLRGLVRARKGIKFPTFNRGQEFCHSCLLSTNNCTCRGG
ncbi:hypothetical protein imdm_2106 [gamma proteobacterium IMCC2047]|nr:hypothetical protein imdm_2106 [gamma proteobacterium IMCC2047]